MIRRLEGTRRLGEMGERQAAVDITATRTFRYPAGDGSMAPRPPMGGGVAMPPPLVGRSSDAPYARNINPPWIEKLGPVSQDVSSFNYALTLAVGAGSTVVLPAVQIPAGDVGFIQEFQLYVQGSTAGTSVTWTLRINGGPVPGFSGIPNPPGVANIVFIPKNDLRIRISTGGVIDVLITNQNANGPWTVGTGWAGWHHSLQAEIDRWGPV